VEIAKRKSNAWNHWRKAFPHVCADFRGTDFTNDAHRINDFSDFEFPDTPGHPCVIFEGAKFPPETTFKGALFGSNANFSESIFEGKSNFENSTFLSCANFPNAKFREAAVFKEVIFKEFANFSYAEFGISTRFHKASFDGNANFMKAKFGYATNFQEVNFGKACVFCESEFDEITEFSSCKFGPNSDFRGSKFNDQSLFIDTEFEDVAIFIEAQFGDTARFEGCKFQSYTYFIESSFGDSTSIVECEFGDYLSFHGANFKTNTRIKINKSGKEIDFSHAVFDGTSDFSKTTFGDHTIFCNAILRGPSKFDDSVFSGDCDFSYTSQKKHGTQKSQTAPFAKYSNANSTAETLQADTGESGEFHAITFCGARFLGDASFKGRKFTSTANFGWRESETRNSFANPTKFFGAAEFHGCTFSQDTSFKGTEFSSIQSDKHALAFRTLKGLMRELNATQEEQLFFRLEIAAEQGNQSNGRKILYEIYRVTSFYGVSIVNPIITLIGFMVVFGLAYGLLANCYAETSVIHEASVTSEARTQQWIRYTAINSIPIPGFDKTLIDLRESLFGKGSEHGWILSLATVLEMVHKLISYGCAFLLGLALRNLFKMKS
jgi:hypothetical protein